MDEKHAGLESLCIYIMTNSACPRVETRTLFITVKKSPAMHRLTLGARELQLH